MIQIDFTLKKLLPGLPKCVSFGFA